MAGGLVVQVNAPGELVGELSAVQWGDTAPADGQTADLVYAGTGCSPVSYAPVADRVQGNIALIEAGGGATSPLDQCPAAIFFQKVQSAQKAGAIGLVAIPAQGSAPTGNATAVTADIPALEVHRTTPSSRCGTPSSRAPRST